MQLIRWILVPVSAFAVWAIALALGLAGVSMLDALCPQELMVSGLCTAWWHEPAFRMVAMLCAAFAAAGVVIVPARIAPARRRTIAIASYLVGAVFANAFTWQGALWFELAAAAFAGTASVLIVIRRLNPNA